MCVYGETMMQEYHLKGKLILNINIYFCVMCGSLGTTVGASLVIINMYIRSKDGYFCLVENGVRSLMDPIGMPRREESVEEGST